MRRIAAALLASGLLASTLLHGHQSPGTNALQFDVVSIKANKSGDKKGMFGGTSGGTGARWVMTNVPIAGLIQTVYPSKVQDLAGAPAWVTTERYDIEARAAFEPTPEQRQIMLRRLLAEYFKLAAHYDTRERPVYNLVMARADRRLGSGLRPIDVDCSTYQPKAADAATAQRSNGTPPCSFRMSGGKGTLSIASNGRTMASLADAIAGLTERPVIDKTGLEGYYAFSLETGDINSGLSIFTALQEQLGLKLEPARAPVDIVVIDHIERPSEQ